MKYIEIESPQAKTKKRAERCIGLFVIGVYGLVVLCWRWTPHGVVPLRNATAFR